MKTEQTHGWVVMNVGFQYNDETYNIGAEDGHLLPYVYASEADAKNGMKEEAKKEIGSYGICSFGFEGCAEPAYAKGKEWGMNIQDWGDGATYNEFFEEAERRNVDWGDFLPNNLYQVVRVDLTGGLFIKNEVPDEEIEKATKNLLELHKEFSDG